MFAHIQMFKSIQIEKKTSSRSFCLTSEYALKHDCIQNGGNLLLKGLCHHRHWWHIAR